MARAVVWVPAVRVFLLTKKDSEPILSCFYELKIIENSFCLALGIS